MTDEARENHGSLFDDAPCGLLVTDADDVITRVNSTLLRWTGFAGEQVLGRPLSSLLDASSQIFYGTRYQDELWTRSEVAEVAFTLMRSDGTPMSVLVNARLVDGDVSASGVAEPTVRVAIFDSSSRQDFEREVQRARRRAETSEASVRALHQAAVRSLSASTETDLAALIAADSRTAFTASDVAVVVYDDGGRSFRILAGTHLRSLLDALRMSRPPGSVALGVDEVLLVADLDEAYARGAAVGDQFRANRIEAFSAVPIGDGDTVIGAIVCVFGRHRRFDEQVVALQRALGRQAGLAFSRVRLQEQLESQARHDQLTGLTNRALIDELVARGLVAARRTRHPISVIFVDLDGFKRINDELGHRAGDLVLQAVATRMVGAVRDVDVVGRFGGDEFLVLCEGAGEDDAALIAERLAAAVRNPVGDLPDGFGVSASIGVAVFVPGVSEEQTMDSMVRHADSAMYLSKRSGPDRITVVRV